MTSTTPAIVPLPPQLDRARALSRRLAPVTLSRADLRAQRLDPDALAHDATMLRAAGEHDAAGDLDGFLCRLDPPAPPAAPPAALAVAGPRLTLTPIAATGASALADAYVHLLALRQALRRAARICDGLDEYPAFAARAQAIARDADEGGDLDRLAGVLCDAVALDRERQGRRGYVRAGA